MTINSTYTYAILAASDQACHVEKEEAPIGDGGRHAGRGLLRVRFGGPMMVEGNSHQGRCDTCESLSTDRMNDCAPLQQSAMDRRTHPSRHRRSSHRSGVRVDAFPNATPILPCPFQIVWAARKDPSLSIRSSNVSGTPKRLGNRRSAPWDDKLRTTQSITEPPSLKTIWAVFKVRVRGSLRLSICAALSRAV